MWPLVLANLAFAAGVHSLNCTREALSSHVDAYLTAQSLGQPMHILSLAAADAKNLTYTENRESINPEKGVLATALPISHNRSLLDTTACATYTELISADPAKPHVIGTQMRFDSSSEKLQLLDVRSVVTVPGDWLFNASQTLRLAQSEDPLFTTIPEAHRDSRAVIQAAADAYLDLFNNKSVVVPWGYPCRRLEGSILTGSGLANDTCDVGVPDGIVISDRRYVIDETVGGVDAMVLFATRPDTHEFRVENGTLRLVHTMTMMRNLTQ